MSLNHCGKKSADDSGVKSTTGDENNDNPRGPRRDLLNIEASISYVQKTAVIAQQIIPFSDSIIEPSDKQWKEWLISVPKGSKTDPEAGVHATPGTFADYLALLNDVKNSMTIPARLAFLAELGDRLGKGYNTGALDYETPLETVYQNFVNGGTDGGVCRDIHAFIADAAEALGFEAAGSHSLLWKKLNDNPAGGHQVSHFRDPDTGLYYIQNYGTIVSSGQTRLDTTIEVSTRMLGQLTGVTFIESKPGTIHQFQEGRSRWIRKLLESQGFEEGKNLEVKLDISNLSQTAGVSFGKTTDYIGNLKGFIIGSNFKAADGNHEMVGVGVAVNDGKSIKFNAKTIDELGVQFSTYVGILQMQVPRLSADPAVNGQIEERVNLFYGTRIKGYAGLIK